MTGSGSPSLPLNSGRNTQRAPSIPAAIPFLPVPDDPFQIVVVAAFGVEVGQRQADAEAPIYFLAMLKGFVDETPPGREIFLIAALQFHQADRARFAKAGSESNLSLAAR